jgi:hypothetical protein
MDFTLNLDLSVCQDDPVKSGLATEQRIPRELCAQLRHIENGNARGVSKNQTLDRHRRVDTNPVRVQAGDLSWCPQQLSELLEEQGPNGIEAWPQYMANPKVPATD